MPPETMEDEAAEAVEAAGGDEAVQEEQPAPAEEGGQSAADEGDYEAPYAADEETQDKK